MVLKHLLFGALLTVLALVVWAVTAAFELGSAPALIAIVAGVVLGLARDRSPLARYGAFFIGLVLGLFALIFGMVGWIGWVLAIVIFTVISALTKGRLPIWAMILGGGALAAIYEPTLVAVPWFLLTDFPTAFFVTLAASSGGFLVTILVELLEDKEESRSAQRHASANPTTNASTPPAPVETGAGSTGVQQ